MVQAFFRKNWMHFAAIATCLVVTLIYFSLQLDGYGIKQHDIEQFLGASHEISDYREMTGEETLWTNSMFGGMPSMQISLLYQGNFLGSIMRAYRTMFSPPAGIVFLYMIGFYIFAMCLRMKPLVGLFAAIAFGFLTYNIVIIQAGHNSKALATAFMAPVIGSFIMTYRHNLRWGLVWSAVFMTFELTMNHLQVSYYLVLLLVVLGAILFVEGAFIKKEMKKTLIASGGLVAVYVLAAIINIGNIKLTNDYGKYSIRGKNDITITPEGMSNAKNSTSGLGKDYITEYSNGIDESLTLLSPYVKGSSMGLIGSNPQFAEKMEDMEFSAQEQESLLNSKLSYWGDQTAVSGPAYMSAVVIILAILAVILAPTSLNIGILLMSVLALALSWGKNYMGLTDFFLENIPGYDKFRAPTIIAVLIQCCLVALASISIHQLWKEREQLIALKKRFLIGGGVLVLLLIIIKSTGLGDGYLSDREKEQLSPAGIAAYQNEVRKELAGTDPKVIQQMGLDLSNQAQVQSIVDRQVQIMQKDYENLKTFRESVFSSSMLRTIIFAIVALGLCALFFYTELKREYIVLGLIGLVALDLIPVDRYYLGNEESGNGYRYWEEKANTLYPISARPADLSILELETSMNDELKKKVEMASREGRAKASELGFSGIAETRVIDAHRFAALNRNTNYRVFDYTGGFSSAKASYFHKSLGGYHGAKLRNIQNVYEFHMTQGNARIFDILNVKHTINVNQNRTAIVSEPNLNAMGNAWLVQRIEQYDTPDQEIMALANRYKVENKGVGQLYHKGQEVKEAEVYASESLYYILQGDTVDIPIAQGLQKNFEVYFVMDVRGNTSTVPAFTIQADTSNSFLKIVSYEVSNAFEPKEEAVLLESEAKRLKKKEFTGKGMIKMKSYGPNELVYEANLEGDQLAVFSEIYYPEGWTATIDGKEASILKVNYLLRGLEVPGGKHEIRFKFDLPFYHTSTKLAASGSILIFLLILFFAYQDWKRKEPSEEASN
ncbi:MAG: hypothetical protein EP338_01490 [Bacteroidetes bacterium]|nr:MAG: hypothetical protein EP338_01490 [Bacteroidota bacterium]